MKSTIALLALALALATAPPHAAAAEPQAIPGTKVALEPPEGFGVAEQFPGFVHPDTGASVMVSEMPAAYDAVAAGFSAEGLLRRGITLETEEEVTIAGRPARLLGVSQVANGVTFQKWMATFGDASSTVMVLATYPLPTASELQAPLRAAVLSATWDPTIELDPFDGLAFRIEESEHLKIEKRVQNLLLLEPPGRVPTATEQPFVVVGSSHSPMEITDIEQFAKQRIAQTAQIKDLSAIVGEPREVAGRPAYEITAQAKDLKSGIPLSLYQMFVVDGQRYFLVQGMVGEALGETYLPEFRAIAESLTIP